MKNSLNEVFHNILLRNYLLVFFGLSPKLGPIAEWGLEISRKTIAVDTEKGLMVPVIPDCDQKNMVDIAADLGAIARKARAGEISLEDTSGRKRPAGPMWLKDPKPSPVFQLPETDLILF